MYLVKTYECNNLQFVMELIKTNTYVCGPSTGQKVSYDQHGMGIERMMAINKEQRLNSGAISSHV